MKTNAIYVADTSAMEYKPGPLVRTWRRQFHAALRLLAPPPGPLWYRAVYWWVASPMGLFCNFFLWFVGFYFLGPRFFVSWLMMGLFMPSAIVYHRNTQVLEKAEREGKAGRDPSIR